MPKVNISLSDDVLKELDRAAHEAKTSRSAFLSCLHHNHVAMELLVTASDRIDGPLAGITLLASDPPGLLRLRRSDDARLTYKGPGSIVEGAMSRQEIEFIVSDFGAAQNFLEALDYQVVGMYEKYRTTYMIETSEVSKDLGGLSALIMPDELPYGNFVEIEGESPAALAWIGKHTSPRVTWSCSSGCGASWGLPFAI